MRKEDERFRPKGMLGAVSGSETAEWEEGGGCITDWGRGRLVAPIATDFALCNIEAPLACSGGGGGSSF